MSKPYIPERTRSRFYVPPTLASDFTEFLDGDIPNTVMDFTLLKDWFDQEAEDYEPVVIRGELYPDSTKSRYVNTDNFLNIRCDVASGIRKGDMLIASNDGRAFLLDWNVSLQSNNAPSRAVNCNMMLQIVRHVNEVVDDMGYMIEPEHDEMIVPAMPANGYRYEGRPEFTGNSGTPGTVPNALTEITVQYNSRTKNIRTDDRFKWGDEWYIVIDVDYVGMNMRGEYGTLNLQARKMPGGIVNP